MTEDEEVRLLDELLDVLDRVVDTSGCPDMVPLWLVATRQVRLEHFSTAEQPPLVVPEHIRVWKGPRRSKWAGLAAWRLAVLAERILDDLERSWREAVEAMYFTPCEENVPPYSWSKASSRHPQLARWPSATVFDLRAKQGCRESVARLHTAIEQKRAGASVADEARLAILGTGTRDGTLRDILRYDTLERPGKEL